MSAKTYHLGVGVGFGLMAAGLVTGITWFFELHPDKNPGSLWAAGALVLAVAILGRARRTEGKNS